MGGSFGPVRRGRADEYRLGGEPPPQDRGEQCGGGGEEGQEAQLRAPAVVAAEAVLLPVELPLRLGKVVEGGLGWGEGFDHLGVEPIVPTRGGNRIR